MGDKGGRGEIDMDYAALKHLRGQDLSTEIAKYFSEQGVSMNFDFTDENWSVEENLMLRMWVHLNTDAEGCYVADDGSCVSPNECPHRAPQFNNKSRMAADLAFYDPSTYSTPYGV